MIRFLSSIKFIKFESRQFSSKLSTNIEGILWKNIGMQENRQIYAVKEWTMDPNQAISEIAVYHSKSQTDDVKDGHTKLEFNLANRSQFFTYLTIKKGGKGPFVTDIDFYSFNFNFPFLKCDNWHVDPQAINKYPQKLYLFYQMSSWGPQ